MKIQFFNIKDFRKKCEMQMNQKIIWKKYIEKIFNFETKKIFKNKIMYPKKIMNKKN